MKLPMFPRQRRWTAKVLCLATLVLASSSAALAQTWRWTADQVDKVTPTFTSIAADNDGNVHISYTSDGVEIKYAYRGANDTRWYSLPLQGTPGYTDIKLDKQGNPHLCISSRKLTYAYWTGKNFIFQEIAPTSGEKGFGCSVAVAPDGTPSVIWYQEKGADHVVFGHLKHAYLHNGAWEIRTVDYDGQTGKWNSAIIDKDGVPHFSYDGFILGTVKLSSFDGSGYKIRVADARGSRPGSNVTNLGMGNSIAIDREGHYHMAYETDVSVKYAHETPKGWDVQVLDSTQGSMSWTGYRTHIVIDSHGNPHVSYEDAGLIKHAYFDGKTWNIQIVARGTSNAMAIDGHDRIYIAYRGASDDDGLMVSTGVFSPAPAPATADQPNGGNKQPQPSAK